MGASAWSHFWGGALALGGGSRPLLSLASGLLLTWLCLGLRDLHLCVLVQVHPFLPAVPQTPTEAVELRGEKGPVTTRALSSGRMVSPLGTRASRD